MKCPGCGRSRREKKANFCSNCGTRLSQPVATQDSSDWGPKSLVTDVDNAADKAYDSTTEKSDKSPKRSNEDMNPKKKKKKRKKSKKKKDDNISSDTDQSDLSLVPTGDKNENKRPEKNDLDCESGDIAHKSFHGSKDDQSTPDKATTAVVGNTEEEKNSDITEKVENQFSPSDSMEGETTNDSTSDKPGDPDLNLATMKGNPQNPNAINQGDQIPKSLPHSKDDQSNPEKATGPKNVEKADKKSQIIIKNQPSLSDCMEEDISSVNQASKTEGDSTSDKPEHPTRNENAVKQNDQAHGQNKEPKPNANLTSKKTQGNSQPPITKQKICTETDSDKEAKAANLMDTNINNKNATNKTEAVKTNPPKLDQNANKNSMDKQAPKNKQRKSKEKETKQEPQTDTGKTTQSSAGSSVDPSTQVENMEVQQSVAPQGLTQGQTTDTSTQGTKEATEAPQGPKRPTRNNTVASHNRLTIYFHAVLSKDFKFDPDEDRIFIRAGNCLGTWKEDTAELFVSRNLGEHGFLVGGTLITSKSEVMSQSIPYKYIIYRNKKREYEYEYIYKHDSQQENTNRCLFVKPHLLNSDGDWHQYDDIICAPPAKSMLKRIKEAFWPDQRKSLVQGRVIAGNQMLETIFDLLKSWSDTNLGSFHLQLNQFFQIYSEPFVYEERQKKWYSLDYGPDDVRKMLKEFMLNNVIPQLQKDHSEREVYIQDPMKAAVIMLYVYKQFAIKLNNAELSQLCKLLCLPNLNKEEFRHYWTKFAQEINILPNVPSMLLFLINAVKKENMPHWVLVLPILHLLKGTSKPFEASFCGNLRNLSHWAGLEGIVGFQNLVYMTSQERRAILNLIKKHHYLIDVDNLLVRSILYLMSLDEILECINFMKPELLDMLQIYIVKSPQTISFMNFELIRGIIMFITQNLIEKQYRFFSETYTKNCMDISVQVLDKICKAVSQTSCGTDIPVACMHLVASVSDFVLSNKPQEVSEVHKEQQYVRNVVLSALEIMRSWISRLFSSSLLGRSLASLYNLKGSPEIEMWNNIISINFKDENSTTEWRQKLTKDFEGKYRTESPLDQIEYYCTNIEQLSSSHSYVASSIERCALDAVTELCQNKSEGKLFEKLTLNMKFGKLISAIIQKSWPRDSKEKYCDDEDVILQHLLSWTAAKNVFQLHDSEKRVSEKLSPEASERAAVAISAFISVVNHLVGGNIKISLLNIILDKKPAFLDLINIDCLCEKEQYKDIVKMKRLLQRRQDEVRAVYHEKELVDILLSMCHKLEEFMLVDLDDMEERHQVNIEDMHLNQFMEVYLFDQILSDSAGVTYFHLDKDIRDMAVAMYSLRDSHIFKVCWEKQARALAKNDPDKNACKQALKMIYKEIFQVCIKEYTDIYTTLKNGTISLEKINELFEAFKGNDEGLTQELEIMCHIDRSDDKQWILSRVQQIEQFHELHLAVASAEIIMRVRKTLHLQGDFSILETLIEVDQANLKRVQISQIDNDLMQAKKDLVDISEPRKDCLQELGLRGHFVDWVKEALEDINELKVFVDLASISAGENDMDVDRVACFHDAVLGYSSMLYELKPDSNFHTFKKVVQKLWRALENDGNLPKKLKDSARHLEWLKTVKDSHGSVELSSLSLASSINKKGVYLISAQTAKKLSLDKALKLHIPGEYDNGRSYSLDDLRELQNKLMLMSGKGDQGQQVDHFAEIFDSVQRLSEAFIALYTAGNPLFRHWKAQISCSINSNKSSIIMDFNLESDLSAVIIDGNIEEQLPDLCKKIEKCLEYWMDFMDKERSQQYYLNYYTAEQIVYLCSNLSQQKITHVDDQTLMMLSFIKSGCSTTDLRQVWHELQYEILNMPQKKNEDIDFQTFTMSELSDVSSEKDILPPLIQQINGLLKFDLLWNTYMKDMKSFLPNILDVRTLGRLLEILANKGTESEDESDEDISDNNITKYICRELPNGLTTGKPNLVVCPHEDILTSCISTYMNSRNEPLPTYDEVLLCTSITPYEQVELFLRRCLSAGYRGNKIYSLLYADVLSYDVSSKVECFFQRIKMQSRDDYRLVMFCSSNREHAYLPSAFSQYKVHIVPQEPLARIQEYLHKHYVVPEDQCSAAAVFKDRLCVGIVSSKRAGVGKSLYIRRLYHKLRHSTKKLVVMNCIRLIEPKVDENTILQTLLSHPERKALGVFHFDVTSSVQKGLNEFLFKLLILRYLMDSEGKVWKCNDRQLYVVEMLEPAKPSARQVQNSSFTDVFPNIFCRPPKEVLEIEMRKNENPNIFNSEDPLMDDKKFRSAAFQRPYQYLARFHNHADLDRFTYNEVEGSHSECLQMLLMHCGIMDPSWAELRNFAWFLNLQLQDCETSVFCDVDFTGDTLIGFKRFVVDFMILMAKDFATPSLSITDQSPGRPQMDLVGVRDEDLAPFLIRKRWETEPHPYIFFNDDHVSMTFIGFHLQPNDHNFVDAIDPASGRVIKRNVMTKQLYDGLMLQRVPFNIDFDRLPRGEKIERMCNVLGIHWPLDPDETYELTTDNILKILAIHMRFRCGIPVIIMGETGCGKTRLIKFLCELRKSGVATENMKLVKVHGGTTSDMIYNKVKEAESMATVNRQDYDFDSVLFFDEANTTEAISSIKEVLCDKTIKGEDLTPGCGLQIIAACNPYRKHTDEMIGRLESAGLGYRVRAEETDEKLGSIPLRQLVYRVHALPPSMIPLVWDFGQLNDDTEKIYIRQIVQRVAESQAIDQSYIECITNVLSASQRYMRKRKDECSFVSLRDVERCMQAFVWFLDHHTMFFAEIERFDPISTVKDRDAVMWSLVMAIGVCYHASLENKANYRHTVSRSLPAEYTPATIMQEISLMQDIFLNDVPMGNTIAKNCALKENVFMMVICIELRIPLFLVGKPGSSKSLSKTLVADAMQGQAAHSDLFKRLKQIHLVSFQCSPHSTPEGIINTFKQCGRFQEGKNLKEYISVVVLDEIGLAEDSPKMPLKTLHPLLEEGCIDDEPLPHKKVGFIGISNWALDPAKMNRGIFVSRGDPDEKELFESAKGICSSDAMVLERVRDFFQPFSRAYLEVCRRQGNGFFGLRDYYSLVKMIFAVAKTSQRKPTAEEIIKAVLRNFSGRDDIDTVTVFNTKLHIAPNFKAISTIEFVKENIEAVGQDEECRYLLVLTKNYAALQILQQTFFKESQPEIIFGSSFPKDQEYTQICRNINRVKICMETGQTVVLLNLQNLYESLYDALNQYYVYLGGQKYVDLGLGTHRVKCRVHKDFRLIVIEEKEVVYKQFPIPLINRLEKHFLDINTVLKTEQERIVSELEKWVGLFVSFGGHQTSVTQMHKYTPADVFIGYHSDTCASVVLQVLENQNNMMEMSDPERKVVDEAKLVLLKCATPDSVVRLDCSELPKVENEHLARVFSEEQNNSCLSDYILANIKEQHIRAVLFTEVTTFSRLLTTTDLKSLEQLGLSVELLSVQQFDTEHSFLKKIRNFLTTERNNKPSINILIVQCDYDESSQSANLIASAKYSSLNEIRKIIQENKVFVYFITRLPRMIGGTSYIGFHGGPWRSVHIDDLRRSNEMVSDIKTLQRMTLGQLFEPNIAQPEAMDVDDDIYMETEQENAYFEKNPTDLDNVLDTTTLLRSCVQSAVGMLRDQVESGFRSTRRVEILLTLLDDSDETKGEFLQTIKKHLHTLLTTHVDNTLLSIKNNWVMKEASNIDALQEGGTFRNTLWKRIQAVVIPMLAHLVSIIDCDQNMDLLLDENCGTSLKRLWLDIFGNDKLLEITHLTVDHNSESGTMLVQNNITQKIKIGCSLPFSWRIRDYLEELWVHALQHEGQTQLEFDDFFWKTPLGRYIVKEDQATQTEFQQRYLQDYVLLTMNVTSKEELLLLCGALNCCMNELKVKLEATDTVTSLPWVHAAYHEFKNRLQNLSRMICIEPQVTRDLLKNPSAKEGVEMVLDVYAAFACVEHLEPTVLNRNDQRQAWLRRVHKLQVPLELVCSEDSVRQYGERSKTFVRRVHDAWNRIFCLSLFVEHMLLDIEELEEKLTPVVLEHTRRLGQILDKDTNLKTKDSFEAVIGLLKNCKEGAVECIFRFGLTRCPVCISDPQDPVCLPCGHIYCLTCIRQWLVPGQMYCPYCMQPLSDDFPVVASDDIRSQINKHAQFRKRCNAFFVELVSTLCFKDNSPPSPGVIRDLLSFLMVKTGPSQIPGATRGRHITTKEFSPFNESIDKSPVVRSVLLKLLLKYSFDQIKSYLEHYLHSVEQSNILDHEEKIQLYSLYINCFEDSMFEKICLQDERCFLIDLLTSETLDVATVDCLQQVARVRLDLDMAASLITEETLAPENHEGPSRSSTFLKNVKDLCRHSGNNWYRVYLIRKIGSQHGVEHVQNLLKVKEMSWLFPDEIVQTAEEVPVDQFLVCGPHYQTIRNAVAQGVMDGTVDGLDEACEGCVPQLRAVFLLLALYREVTTLYRETTTNFHPKAEQLNSWVGYIERSKVLSRPELKAFARALVTNQLGPLSLSPAVSSRQCVLVELTVYLAAVLLCGTQGVLGPLRQLALEPATMQAAFLPSMPEDMLAVAKQAMGQLQWYYCLNGHPCTIGECGRPTQTSLCVDCGAVIGGNNHIPVKGFQLAQLHVDHTQTGHILGDPRRRDNPDMMDTKSLSPVPFTIIRMVTHMSMLFGFCNNAQMISTIIKPQVADPGGFLLAHLEKDLKHVTRALGKGADETVSSVHLFISSLLHPPQQQTWPVRFDNQLSSRDARNNWEIEMGNAIASHLKNLERQLNEVNTFIRSDERISASPIMKVMFGDPRLFLGSLPQNSLIYCNTVWSCREKVSVVGLTHILEQNDGKDTLPVLWRFLLKEAEYRLVKFLPDILTLQRNLVKKCQNISELCDTIGEFLQSQISVSLKAWYQKHIDIYLTTWNQLRVILATNGEIKIPTEFCQNDLDINSNFRFLLPSRRGPGLCSTALVSYLIALHNDLVYSVDKLTGEETSYKVSPADLTDLHVIRYELDRDLMPLVLSNTQYSIEKGQETLHEYDLPKIQRQIVSRFLMGKPLITLTGIPTLVNRHDRNYEVILKDVKAKIKQEPLQALTLSAVSTQLDSYSEVCEALSTLEVALGFLAMTGGDPHMQLSCYLKEVLKMGNQTPPHILKALSMCYLKHCSALWQLLASLKSERLLKLKRDPFGEVLKDYKLPLGADERRLLTGFFAKNSADSFLLEMHEFLVLVLNKPNATDTYKPEWSLKDTLVAYIDRKDLDVPPDVEDLFPDEICLCHFVEAWKFSVGFKQERTQRQ